MTHRNAYYRRYYKYESDVPSSNNIREFCHYNSPEKQASKLQRDILSGELTLGKLRGVLAAAVLRKAQAAKGSDRAYLYKELLETVAAAKAKGTGYGLPAVCVLVHFTVATLVYPTTHETPVLTC